MTNSDLVFQLLATGSVLWISSKLVQQLALTARNRSLMTKYKEWVERAHQERENKKHTPLNKSVDGTPPLTALETSQRIASGKLEAHQNVVNLAHRCRSLGRAHGAIAEELYEEAYQSASSLPPSKSKLHGVAISIKEYLGVQDCYATVGMMCRLRERRTEDCLLVSVLRSQGLLPLCTSNLMQLTMLAESDNRIWGRVDNPWDRTRTAGGSSGGDGALVALRCVPLAVASDVAGSIRIPAASCGVVGFKPTSRRTTSKGNPGPAKEDKVGSDLVIASSNGTIATSVDDCAAFMETILIDELFDQERNLPRMPFDTAVYQHKKPYKIAYFKTDGWFEPCVTSLRAVDEAVAGLRKQGHAVEEIAIPLDGWFSYGLLVAINVAEGKFRSFVEGLEGEPIMPHYDALMLSLTIPEWLRFIVCRVIDARRSHLLSQGKANGCSVFELWKKLADIKFLKNKWSDAMQGYDAVVMPAVPIPAPPHGLSGEITGAYSYMFNANMLDWPCGSVPVTQVRKDETHYNNCPHNDEYTRLVREKVMPGSEGMPMSVNVMACAFEDEKCLHVMKEIESAVNFKALPPVLEETA